MRKFEGEIQAKKILHEKTKENFSKTSKTSFLRGYNTYTR